MECAENFLRNRIVSRRYSPDLRSCLPQESTPPKHKSLPPEEDIPHTIQKAMSGDQKAYSQLLDRFWPEVYGYQLKRTRNENDAEDITIQTFARAFDKLDTYDPQYAFSTWLVTISKNLHVDLLRKRKRNVLEQRENNSNEAMKRVLDESPSVEDHLIIEQNLKTLLENIKKLKAGYQQVLELRFFREMSYAEIAQELDEPVGNIKVKLLRAKKLLASLITESRKNG